MVAEKEGQPNWIDLGRSDLRHTASHDRLAALATVAAGVDAVDALTILAQELGFLPGSEVMHFASPIGNIGARREHLPHIVEKRADARERYVKFAIATMSNPFEIWEVAYDNQRTRLAFIGLFEGKRQMLVVIEHSMGRILWNFMHCDHKSLNKHRQGSLIYVRPEPGAQKTKGEPIEDSPEAVPNMDTAS